MNLFAFGTGQGILVFGLVVGALVLLAALGFIAFGLKYYRRYPAAKEQKRYAFFIPARNEENVIADTIASIRAMDYPQDKVSIFVLANNCSDGDRTAEIARALGEEVFELKDKSVKNVGMVLERFFDYIKERYGDYDAFDGYVRLDADNLVHKDFMKKLNDAFCVHPYVVTAYRANQNFNDGVKASLTCLLMTQSMMAFRLFSGWGVNPIITGPGLLIGAEVLKQTGGWRCNTISEDMEFSAVLIKHKIRAHFCYDAIFYDEQPDSIKIAFRQNIRWAKGVSQIFFKYWFTMIARVFSSIGFSAIFMVIGLVPIGLLTVTFTTAFAIYGFVVALQTGTFLPAFMFCIMPIIVNLVLGWVMAIVTFIIERKRIDVPMRKKILYILAFPLAYAIRNLSDVIRLFVRTAWKPIPHGQVKQQQAIVGTRVEVSEVEVGENENNENNLVEDTLVEDASENTDETACENAIENADENDGGIEGGDLTLEEEIFNEELI